MSKIVVAHGGRLEIFVDALEFAVMETSPRGAAKVLEVRRQLCDMVRQGHQLQLHVHPQWHGASLIGGEWIVDHSGWRIGGRDIGQVRLLVEHAHNWLRGVLAEGPESASCIAFRAGGWCVQPSREVLSALRSIGFKMDSSVAPGMRNRDRRAWYDFRKCPNRAWWRVDDDVTCLGDSDFIEVPITTGRLNPARNIYSRIVRRREGEFADRCRGTYRSRSTGPIKLLGYWRKFQGARRAMLDYCALPTDLMIDMIKNWTGRFDETQTPVPVVAIGHTKNFSPAAERALDELLTWISGEADLQIGTYASWWDATNR